MKNVMALIVVLTFNIAGRSQNREKPSDAITVGEPRLDCPASFPPRVTENQRRSEAFLERAIRLMHARDQTPEIKRIGHMLEIATAGAFDGERILRCRSLPGAVLPARDDERFYFNVIVVHPESANAEIPEWAGRLLGNDVPFSMEHRVWLWRDHPISDEWLAVALVQQCQYIFQVLSSDSAGTLLANRFVNDTEREYLQFYLVLRETGGAFIAAMRSFQQAHGQRHVLTSDEILVLDTLFMPQIRALSPFETMYRRAVYQSFYDRFKFALIELK